MPRIAPTLALLIALPLPGLAQQMTPAETAAYRHGFTDGVAAVNAQLGQVTAQMQQQVQAQVNDQIARLDAEKTRELEERLAAAQRQALEAQGSVSAAPVPRPDAAPASPGLQRMPQLPPLTRAPGGGIVPSRNTGTLPDLPADAASLPPGTTITITDPQNLPPDLFRALMSYTGR